MKVELEPELTLNIGFKHITKTKPHKIRINDFDVIPAFLKKRGAKVGLKIILNPGDTICFINTEHRSYRGISSIHPSDNHKVNKFVGKKMALKRAMDSLPLTKHERTIVWGAFLDEFKKDKTREVFSIKTKTDDAGNILCPECDDQLHFWDNARILECSKCGHLYHINQLELYKTD